MAREGGWKVRKYLYRECSLLVGSSASVELLLIVVFFA